MKHPHPLLSILAGLFLGAQTGMAEGLQALSNPGFEAVVTLDAAKTKSLVEGRNWKLDGESYPNEWNLSSCRLDGPVVGVVADEKAAHSGKNCLKLVCPEETRDAFVYQRIPLAGNSEIKVTFWAKGEETATVSLSLYFYGEKNKYLGGDTVKQFPAMMLDETWQEHTFEYRAPEGATFVILRLNPQGTVYLDDVTATAASANP